MKFQIEPKEAAVDQRIMFPILLGRLERPCLNEDDQRTWLADRRDLLNIVTQFSTLLNEGEKDALARILNAKTG